MAWIMLDTLEHSRRQKAESSAVEFVATAEIVPTQLPAFSCGGSQDIGLSDMLGQQMENAVVVLRGLFVACTQKLKVLVIPGNP
ncbi:unnamed protein product [Linum tenue]|uniref:Uncharacterized protein n=1 Tax=Linum tenue TaxID=586396 RepID=A0AAV0KFU2_9ROSI|nr:unnamed protein product [Linum tenue]